MQTLVPKKKVRFICPTCNGEGGGYPPWYLLPPPWEWEECPTCHGLGYLEEEEPSESSPSPSFLKETLRELRPLILSLYRKNRRLGLPRNEALTEAFLEAAIEPLEGDLPY